MRAIFRVGTMLVAAALAASPTVAGAQAASPPPTTTTTNSTSPVTVGPSELQNFNLKGTVTRPADGPAVTTPARPQTAPVKPPALDVSTSRSPPTRSAERQAPAAPPRTSQTASPAPAPEALAPAAVEPSPNPVLTPAPMPAVPAPSATPVTGDELATPSKFTLWPWIAVALALAAAAGLLLWRRSHREPVAAGPQFDLLVPAAPQAEPQPQPRPRAQPPAQPEPRAPAPVRRAGPPPASPAPVPPSPRPAASGIVASRLRPALELGFQPLSCRVDDDQVRLEFEIELFNAGTAPARAVLAEASLLNAGATQERDLAAFFSNPNGVGERLDVIPQLKRVNLRSEVIAPRSAVQEYELAGRKAFIPVIAFNALYEWSGGRGQSSSAFLVGRDTQQEKLGPLRLEQGAREYRQLGARPLPTAVRT